MALLNEYQLILRDVTDWLIERARWSKTETEFECLWSIIKAIDEFEIVVK